MLKYQRVPISDRHCQNDNSSRIKIDEMPLTLVGMRQGGFTSLILLELHFVSWIFIKKIPNIFGGENWDQSG